MLVEIIPKWIWNSCASSIPNLNVATLCVSLSVSRCIFSQCLWSYKAFRHVESLYEASLLLVGTRFLRVERPYTSDGCGFFQSDPHGEMDFWFAFNRTKCYCVWNFMFDFERKTGQIYLLPEETESCKHGQIAFKSLRNGSVFLCLQRLKRGWKIQK